eukprot:Gb_26455 [translate_table: standard]
MEDTDLVVCVGWSLSDELYSCSEDQTIWRWSRNGEPLNKASTTAKCHFCVCKLDKLLDGSEHEKSLILMNIDGTSDMVNKGKYVNINALVSIKHVVAHPTPGGWVLDTTTMVLIEAKLPLQQ